MRRLGILLLTCILVISSVTVAYGSTTSKNVFGISSRTHDSQFDGMNIYNGVDVSEWQYVIDWAKARNGGVDFAIIRCGYRGGSAGTLATDNYFKRNIEGAIANGIPVGIYFFSQALTTAEAVEEADYVISLIKDYEVTLPVFIDFEYQKGFRMNSIIGTSTSKKTKATNNIIAFIKEMQANGYESGVYASTNCYNTNMYPAKIEEAGGIFWIAQYNTSCTYTKTPYSIWQHTSSGTVPGMSGKIDCNFWYGDDEYFTKRNPSKVYGLKQSAKSDTSITISWTKCADADTYHIYRSDSASGTYTEVGTSNTNSFTDTGLSKYMTYYYKVSAENSSGTGQMSSALSAATVLKPGQTKGLAQTGKTRNTVTLGWTKTEDADSYNIYRSKTSSGTYTLAGTSKTNSYIDKGLADRSTYYYKVEAVNGAGTGEKSAAAEASTITEVSKVTGLKRTARTVTSITLSWNADSNAEGYYVYRSSSYDGTYKKIATVKTNSYKNTGLTQGKHYYYKVKAYNYIGDGNISGLCTMTSKPKADRYGTVLNSDVKICKRSGDSYASLGTAKKGETVTIYASTDAKDASTWYKVKHNGVTGYIPASSVSVKTKITTLYTMNLRKGPSTSYGTYCTVPANMTRVVYQTKIVSGETWYQVKYTYKGVQRTGWICGYTKTGSNVTAKNL